MKQMLNRLLCLVSVVLFAGTALAQGGSASGNEIQSINVGQQAGAVVVKLGFKDPLAGVPASFSVANPARVAIDLPATNNGLGRNSQSFNEGGLRSVNFVQTPEKMRVVLNLNQPLVHDLRVEERSLLITLSPSAASAASAAGGGAQQVTQFAPARSVSGHAIRDVGFRRGKDGEARVTVDLSDTSTGIDIRQEGSVLLVEFAKTSLPEHLRKRMDVTDFATPVTSFTASQQGENTRLTITPKGLWEHNAYQTDTQFVIEVKPIIENPNKLVQGSRGGYQGEKLSLNFQNVDVRRLLQVIGEFTGMNIVVSDTVAGNLTLILKDVPWDQALDIILQQRGLDMRKNGNVILIAPREEIATKEKLEFESRQQIGDLEPLRSESFQLNYHKAKAVFDFLKNKDQTLLSKRGSVIVDERTNKLFVSDTPGRLDDLRRLISEIDIPVRQVLIEARIVEASDSFSKDLGVRLGWNMGGSNESAYRIGNDGVVRGNVMTGASLANTGFQTGQISTQPNFLTDSLNVNLPANPRSGRAGALSFVLFNSARSQFLNLEVSALEADGRGKVISSPRVVTADQVEALIEQGVEIPYQQATSSGATSVSFRKANLALKVKPQITPDGKITMTLDVNKDTPNTRLTTGAGVAIDTKHVKTEVLVENGGTVVIGGIYQQELRESNSRIPVLGEIPYLGWLFRNSQKTDDKTELLVFITPRIITDAMTIR
ncbi:type IV pilus secretin PilQ [Azospira restricta]|uniref:Type IV pilus biogenesis and competence protein PilQ n=2 Tax=Azospira restricta TaxID=404405 RepID=A0A974Y5U4_9RHOO|nr:type IV pilus secretin PilQ [Azospira restricta]